MRVRSTAPVQRSVMAMVLALAFALRLLAPAGFMPSFEGGAVTIVSCPDAWGAVARPDAPMGRMGAMASHQHHHDGKSAPQPCPYAGAAPAGTLPDAGPETSTPAIADAAPRETARAERLAAARTRDRPPATAPPFPPRLNRQIEG